MAKGSGRRALPVGLRAVQRTDQFKNWERGLHGEQRAKVSAAIDRVVAGGPTMGRPHVDTLHGSNLAKLKEVRVDRGTRLLFAFDSNLALVVSVELRRVVDLL
jgi:hypothetical protein